MNASDLSKHYASLTPEERFRLILAAGARGDKPEQNRLAAAGRPITRSLQDHAPHAHAFEEVALMTFLLLLEEAARYVEAFADSEAAEEEAKKKKRRRGRGAPAAGADAAEGEKETPAEGWFTLAMAKGCALRIKADGWKLFCERLNVPPFAFWERLPGFERLQHALAAAEKAAFVPEGMLRWINEHRPEGEPERAELRFSAVAFAEATEKMFRERAQWWGG